MVQHRNAGSVNAEGYPHPVVLAKIAAQGYNEVCMATDGEVEIISDDATRQRLWQKWLAGFFPGGPAAPTIPRSASWDKRPHCGSTAN